MGKNQSKVLNGVNLSKKGDSGRDTAELSLVRGRSTSLDSVSTALSLGIGQPRPLSQAHYCSVDDLQPLDVSCSDNHQHIDAGDVGVASDRRGLVDSGVSSGAYPTEEEGGNSPQRGFTQSLPADIECRTRSKVRNGGRDVDGFSDNFVTDNSGDLLREELAVNTTDAPQGGRDSLQTHQDSPVELPNIPASLLQKLSPEELTEFITFVWATLGNSLQASLNETRDNLLNNTCPSGQTKSSKTGSSKHVPVSERGSGCVSHPAHSRRHHHCKPKHLHRGEDETGIYSSRERPSSIPSLHLRDNPELIERLRLLSRGTDSEEHAGPREARSRSKSQDDGHHDDWHRYGRSERCVHRSTRRRRGGRLPRESCGRVDVSLDDNCPGLRQNRVGRRNHRHQQQAVCELCLKRLGDHGNHQSPPPRRQRHKELLSASGEITSSDSQQRLNSDKSQKVDESFMTLEDLKLMTSEFFKGTNDLDESVIQDLKMQFITGMAEQMKLSARNFKKCGEHSSVRLDAIQPFLSRNWTKTKAFHLAEPSDSRCGNWQQLMFPREARTGLDSPRTDMAVFNLDMKNDHNMCQSILLSEAGMFSDRATPAIETGSRLYLHKHHHIHHIIHHSQP